jgi:hypothetical protein
MTPSKIRPNDLPSLDRDPQITTTIKDNPWKANAEIEKDEYVLRSDLSAIYKAVGKTHKQGGIDTYLPEGSFVFSDDKTLALDEDDLDLFELKKGPSFAKDKNTPAETLKRNVNIKHYNKMTSIIEDRKKDDLSKRTAAMMLSKYENTVGRIAYVQEAKKDFPQGIPEFAEDTAPVYVSDVKNEIMEQKQYMKKGGYFQRGGSAYKAIRDKVWGPQVSANTKTKVSPNPQDLFDPYWSYLANERPDELLLAQQQQGNPYVSLLSPQHLDEETKGLYGKGLNPDDFKRRQAWYLQNHPNFSFSNPKDVADFQTAYNDEAKKRGYPAYFGGNGFRGIDSKYGRYTDAAPGFPVNDEWTGPAADPLPPVTVSSSPRQKGPTVPTLNVPAGKRTDINWQFNPWQKLNMSWDALNAASVRQEFPYRSQIKSPLVELERVNPQAALNQADNAAFRASQTSRGLNPYLAAGVTESVYGSNLDAKQAIQSQYDNQNVGIGNQQNVMNAQSQANDLRFNVGADQQYYRETVEGRKNFDNLKQASWNNFRQNMNKYVEDNQSLAYNLASQPNAPYGYDFKTGQFYLTGKNPLDVYTNPGQDYFADAIKKIDPSTVTPAQAQYLKALAGMKALSFPSYYDSGKFRKGGSKRNPWKK